MKKILTKKWLAVPAVTLALLAGGSAFAQAYINVTVGGAFAPGVYGQIAIGSNPPPPVMNAQPVIYGQPVYGAAPIYLHVPEEQSRHWDRYCMQYRACGHPVYFVQMEPRNPWWTKHNEHLRGREADRVEPEHREDRREERR